MRTAGTNAAPRKETQPRCTTVAVLAFSTTRRVDANRASTRRNGAEMSDDTGNVSLNITLRDSDGGEITLRQIALGYQPMVLIEPFYDEDTDDGGFSIDATDIGQDELVDVLRMLADTLERDERVV